MPWITLAPRPTAVAASDAHVAAGGRARAEAGVVGDARRRGRPTTRIPSSTPQPSVGAVADHCTGEDDRARSEGGARAEHRGRVHDRRGLEVRRRRARPFEDTTTRRVVADGDDEVVGAHLRRAHRELVVAAEHGTPTTSVTAWQRPVEHADRRCGTRGRRWRRSPAGPGPRRRSRSPGSLPSLPRNGSMVACPGALTPWPLNTCDTVLPRISTSSLRGPVVDVPDVERELLVPGRARCGRSPAPTR